RRAQAPPIRFNIDSQRCSNGSQTVCDLRPIRAAACDCRATTAIRDNGAELATNVCIYLRVRTFPVKTMKPIKGVVFDLYGTLYDVHSVASLCSQFYPGRGLEISMLWRQKQLEYTWLRSLMGSYAPFEQVTDDALGFIGKQLKLNLTRGAH